MDQQRLFVLAPEAMHLQATYVAGVGWNLTIGMRRQDEEWRDSYRASYAHLSTDEMIDVACAELSEMFRTS